MKKIGVFVIATMRQVARTTTTKTEQGTVAETARVAADNLYIECESCAGLLASIVDSDLEAYLQVYVDEDDRVLGLSQNRYRFSIGRRSVRLDKR